MSNECLLTRTVGSRCGYRCHIIQVLFSVPHLLPRFSAGNVDYRKDFTRASSESWVSSIRLSMTI